MKQLGTNFNYLKQPLNTHSHQSTPPPFTMLDQSFYMKEEYKTINQYQLTNIYIYISDKGPEFLSIYIVEIQTDPHEQKN